MHSVVMAAGGRKKKWEKGRSRLLYSHFLSHLE